MQAARKRLSHVTRSRLPSVGVECRDLDQHVGGHARNERPHVTHRTTSVKRLERLAARGEPQRPPQVDPTRLDRYAMARRRDARDADLGAVGSQRSRVGSAKLLGETAPDVPEPDERDAHFPHAAADSSLPAPEPLDSSGKRYSTAKVRG